MLGFSVNVLAGIEFVGGRWGEPTETERADYVALWRYVGWLLGVDTVETISAAAAPLSPLPSGGSPPIPVLQSVAAGGTAAPGPVRPARRRIRDANRERPPRERRRHRSSHRRRRYRGRRIPRRRHPRIHDPAPAPSRPILRRDRVSPPGDRTEPRRPEPSLPRRDVGPNRLRLRLSVRPMPTLPRRSSIGRPGNRRSPPWVGRGGPSRPSSSSRP